MHTVWPRLCSCKILSRTHWKAFHWLCITFWLRLIRVDIASLPASFFQGGLAIQKMFVFKLQRDIKEKKSRRSKNIYILAVLNWSFLLPHKQLGFSDFEMIVPLNSYANLCSFPPTKHPSSEKEDLSQHKEEAINRFPDHNIMVLGRKYITVTFLEPKKPLIA